MSRTSVCLNLLWSHTSDKTPRIPLPLIALFWWDRRDVLSPPAPLGLGQMVQSLEQMLTTRAPSLSVGQCTVAQCHTEALARSGTHLTTIPLLSPAVLPTMLLAWHCSLAMGFPGAMECCAVQGRCQSHSLHAHILLACANTPSDVQSFKAEFAF